MKELAALFIPTSNSGVVHWRVQSWVDAAYRNRAGFYHNPWWMKECMETHPWERDIEEAAGMARLLGELDQKVRQADVVVMQMVHYPGALHLFQAIKTQYPHIPVVAEIDDNMMSTAEYNPAFPFYAPGHPARALAVEQFRAADAMIVSTPYLKEVYSEFCDHIYVVENSVDLKAWGSAKKRAKPGIRIGWAGGSSHSEDLRIIEPVVKNILAKNKNVKFSFIHGVPEFLKGIPRVEVVSKWARIDRYPQHIASQGWDIALAPLVDSAFNRGKSNIRWLEAAALGIPTVASNVGHFAQTLKHGEDAMLADGPEEFEKHIQTLINDKNFRRRLGGQAHMRARKDFNIDINVHKYTEILKEVRDRGQVKKPEIKDYMNRHVMAGEVINESWPN